MLSFDCEVLNYRNSRTGREPVSEYVLALPEKERKKIVAFVQFLASHGGHLDEPYAKKVWNAPFRELIVNFGRNGHRIFYFAASGRRIILLHVFSKKTRKTPVSEIAQDIRNFNDFMDYDQEKNQA